MVSVYKLTENRQYNLRSANRDTVSVPVQLQIGNTDFMSTVLNQNNDSHSDSVSDSNDSQSDLDCSGLLNLSNDEGKSKSSGKDSIKTDEVGNHMQASTSSADFSPQLMINQQILDQLQTIGRRLDKLEQKPVKKSSDPKKIKNKTKTKQTLTSKEHTTLLSSASDVAKNTNLMDQSIPNLASLRQDIQIQQQVQQRLATLAQQQVSGMDHKVKSQRGGPDVFVKNRVRWPHEYVLSSSTKERVTYDQLTVVQWVSGF